MIEPHPQIQIKILNFAHECILTKLANVLEQFSMKTLDFSKAYTVRIGYYDIAFNKISVLTDPDLASPMAEIPFIECI